MYRIELQTRHPSLNTWITGQSWHHKAKQKKEAQELILWRLKQEKVPTLTPPIHLQAFQFTKQPRDHENTILSCKYMLDALVEGGYIPDDSPDYVDSVMTAWRKATKEEKVVYMITEL